jgi:hypothetical protein
VNPYPLRGEGSEFGQHAERNQVLMEVAVLQIGHLFETARQVRGAGQVDTELGIGRPG